MEQWNAGIFRVKAEATYFNCKKFLSFNFVQHKITHYSIIPIVTRPFVPFAASPFFDRQGEANPIDLYRSFSTATPRSGAVGLSGRQAAACGISGSGHQVFIGTG
jgi:hypothetical protein